MFHVIGAAEVDQPEQLVGQSWVSFQVRPCGGSSRAVRDQGGCVPGVAYKRIAIYAPVKDGSFQRVLVVDSNRAGWLAVALDPKSGVLELRERANSELKGEVVLSCNLKTVGTAHSTGVVP